MKAKLSAATKRKANAFIKEATEAGWEIEIDTIRDKDEGWQAWVKAHRDGEILILYWYGSGGSFGHPSWYRFQGSEARVRNVADARRRLTGTPTVNKRKAKATFRSEKAVTTISQMVMPFDTEALTKAAEAVKKHLYGATLVWQNPLSGTIEEATVPAEWRVDVDKSGRHFKIHSGRLVTLKETSKGRWVLTFPAVHGTFRSVALDEILQVK